VRDPPEYVYREYESYGTLRCEVLIFVGRSTLYPDIEPWFISTTGFGFADKYPKAARKAPRRLRVVYRQHLKRTPMGFFPPSRGRGRSWIDRVRELAREEEDLEDAVSHLSIYLNGLDHLYHEQAQQLKHQIDRAERAEQRIELERIKTTMAKVARANLEQDYLRERERTLIANKALWDEVKERRREKEVELEEEEPEETHWDKGTQTEDMIPEQDLPQRSIAFRRRKSPHKDRLECLD
jgi:CRISPR/Cas system CMR-associated protein Cmr5 small subunit